MKLLAVETATRYQSVALMDGTVLLAEKSQDNCSSHAGSLIPAIQGLLASLPCPFSAIEGLAVSAGPGSFTGLRVGLSTMVGFRTVTGLPLVTVPTLEAMAWSHRSSVHPVCPMLVARTNEVYWAQFQWKDGQVVRLLEDRVGTIRDMMDSIRQPTVFFGEGGCVISAWSWSVGRCGPSAVRSEFDETRPPTTWGWRVWTRSSRESRRLDIARPLRSTSERKPMGPVQRRHTSPEYARW